MSTSSTKGQDRPLIWVDGGMGTSLQERGLAPGKLAVEYNQHHGQLVRATHQAFIDAGAGLVCANSLGFTQTSQATHALSLIPSNVPCILSVGEGTPLEALEGLPLDTPLLLETFVSTSTLCTLIETLRERSAARQIIASLVPPKAGSKQLLDKTPLFDALQRLADAGATGVGFNCGWSALDVLDAITAAKDPGVPLWACPSFSPEYTEVCRQLGPVVTWLGGCCGVSPSRLKQTRIELDF